MDGEDVRGAVLATPPESQDHSDPGGRPTDINDRGEGAAYHYNNDKPEETTTSDSRIRAKKERAKIVKSIKLHVLLSCWKISIAKLKLKNVS